MDTYLVATAAVALGELGDKTQLLSLMLAARYRRPLPIIAGILIATLVNHAIAGAVGDILGSWLTPTLVHWAVIIALGLMAIWMLIPDKAGDDGQAKASRHGVLWTTIITFFLAEMGDKTQLATMVLAAHYHPLWQVIAGTTTGMLIADVPVVWLGARWSGKLPLKATRIAAALLFAGLAIWTALSPVSATP